MSAPLAKRRAFAVWFKDLDRWDVRSLILLMQNHCGWQTETLGTLCKIRSEIVSSAQRESSKIQLLDRISFDEGRVHSGKRTQTKMTQFRACPGDIVVSKINARKRAIGVVPSAVMVGITMHFRALIPDTDAVDTTFLWLALRSTYCKNQFEIETGGVGKGEISEERLLSIKVPIPPLETQRAIVAAWDAVQTLQRDGLSQIQARERQIDADFLAALGLQMPRRAKPRKCFAVWWKDLERWGVQINRDKLRQPSEPIYEGLSLREICKIGSGGTPKSNRTDFYGGDILWVRTTEVKNALITQTGISITETGLNSSSAKIYPKGSILVAMYGQGATRGRTGKLGMDAATNQACAVLHHFIPEVEPDYVWCYLMSQYDNLRSLASGNNQPNLNAEMVGSLKIPLPPLETQRAIMAQVASERDEVGLERAALSLELARAKAELERALLGTAP